MSDDQEGSVWQSLAWHGAAAAALLVAPTHWRLGPLWSVDPGLYRFYLALVVTYAVGASGVAVLRSNRRRPGFVGIGTAAVAALAGLFLFLLLTEAQYARSILLAFAAGLPLALVLSVVLSTTLRTMLTGALVLATLIVVGIGVIRTPEATEAAGPTESVVEAVALPDSTVLERSIVPTALYEVDAIQHHGLFGTVAATGGAIERLGDDRYLVALADGRLYTATTGSTPLERPVVTQLGSSVPMARDAYLEDVEGTVGLNPAWFRTADILVQEIGGSVRVFASHHHWDRANQCAALRISVAEGSRDSGEFTLAPWRTLFDARPCLSLKAESYPFTGEQSGGRMALLADDTLLLTVGDHEFDGMNAGAMLPQDPDSSYGKTIRIDLSTETSRVFSTGHRNPEGLLVRSEGDIWLTEHGPRGGDELNRVVEGNNYGWPIVTFGTAYMRLGHAERNWPFNPQQGAHQGYARPIFAWVPSIGVSALLELEDALFERWNGDLIVASLSAETLFRLRLAGDRVVFAEPIPIGARIRDLVQGHDGELVLLTEPGAKGYLTAPGIVLLEPVTEASIGSMEPDLEAELLFTECLGCHTSSPTEGDGIGPNLFGVVGRDVASVEGFTYSRALLGVGGVWSGPRLDAFLQDPGAFVPGTSMATEGIPDAEDRERLIGYLTRLD